MDEDFKRIQKDSEAMELGLHAVKNNCEAHIFVEHNVSDTFEQVG